MNQIAVADLTAEAFAPFDTIGAPIGDGSRDFDNLELTETTTEDYAVCRLAAPVAFAP